MPSAYETFQANIKDAELLLSWATAFENQRTRRMRRELRQRIGDALRLPQAVRKDLDCLESSDVFVVFKPDGQLVKSDFDDLRPMLRPTIVVACAALETFVADRVMEIISTSQLTSSDLTSRLGSVPLSVADWLSIEENYKRRRWGLRAILDDYFEQVSSTAPNRIGEVLAAIDFRDWSKKVDNARGLDPGATVTELEQITTRRNLIAHSADRKGRGRAHLDTTETRTMLDQIHSIALALEDLLSEHVFPKSQ